VGRERRERRKVARKGEIEREQEREAAGMAVISRTNSSKHSTQDSVPDAFQMCLPSSTVPLCCGSSISLFALIQLCGCSDSRRERGRGDEGRRGERDE
jgi:hypothetical protein